MCLDSISRTKPKSEGTGWKIVGINTKTKIPYCGRLSNSEVHKAAITKRWLSSMNPNTKIQYTDHGRTYPSGFHLFLTEKDAQRFIENGHFIYSIAIIKIDYKEAHTQGKQANIPVIVANKIRLHTNK